MGSPDGDLDQRCAEVVDRLVTRYGWQLIDRAEFARRTRAALEETGGENVWYAAYGSYNLVLYQACSGDEGADRREQAYGELFRVLYDRAAKAYPDVCEDATQLALADVIARFQSCKEPRAFLPFALTYLMGAARTLRRREGRTSSLELEVGDEGLTLGDTLAAPTDVEEEAADHERREQLHDLLERYLRRYPRARKQIDAVRLKFLLGLDDERISAELGVSVPNVHVLRSRGLSRLRDDPDWGEIWESDF